MTTLEHFPTQQAGFGSTQIRTAAGRYSAPGKGHDRVMRGPDFLAVADGATPLHPSWPDAGDFAQSALALLCEYSQDDRLSIQQVWRAAIEMAAYSITVPAVQVSCAVAMARENNGCTEVAVCGDCTAFIKMRNRSTIEIRDERVRLLNAEADASWGAGSVSKQHVRELMNTDDGYWIFSINPVMTDHIVNVTAPTEDIDSILLFTDGFLTDSALPIIAMLKEEPLNPLLDGLCRLTGPDMARFFDDDACFLKATIL